MLERYKRKQGTVGCRLRSTFRRNREGNAAEINSKSAVMLFVPDDNAVNTHLLKSG